MKEIRNIVKAYDEARQQGIASVLASVVLVDGSSYRRPGARMIVLEDGAMVGAISGGCLEGDARNKALLTLTERSSRIVIYDTSDEDDAVIGVQLGCEGVIHVLFEYIDPADPANPIELLRKAISVRAQAVLVTLYDTGNKRNPQTGTCLLWEQEGKQSGRIPLSTIAPMVEQDCREVVLTKQSRFTQYNAETGPMQAFIEFLQVPISLVLIGAGNDALPVMQLAELLGWELRVADGRITHARTERFTSACQVLVSKPEAILESIPTDERTCFVLMTHNYNYDLQMLRSLLPTAVPYIGILGPVKKRNRMLDQLKAEGIIITEEMLSRIHGPVGLDIGAETAEEIAASIVAEIQAFFTGRNGGMLKWKKDPIH